MVDTPGHADFGGEVSQIFKEILMWIACHYRPLGLALSPSFKPFSRNESVIVFLCFLFFFFQKNIIFKKAAYMGFRRVSFRNMECKILRVIAETL